MSLLDDFKILTPEFADEDDATINKFLGWAALQVNRTRFGLKADLATLYLAAHMLARANASVAGAGAEVGAVASEKIGDITTTYSTGVVNSTRSDLSTTSYGIEFASLMRQIIKTPLVV